MIARACATAIAALAALVLLPGAAGAQERPCGHVVVFTLPGITWSDVERARPPALLGAARNGAVGSVSVRTNEARTSYPSAFATLGAGARVDAPPGSGGPAASATGGGVVVTGLDTMRKLAAEAGYGARLGALADALDARPVVAIGNGDLGAPPPVAAGFGRWALLAAMNGAGFVDAAATDPALLVADPAGAYGVWTSTDDLAAAVDDALAVDCSTLFVDPGDLARADAVGARSTGAQARLLVDDALRRSDALLARVRASLDVRRDLLLVLSPTSPAAASRPRLGIAVAEGADFTPGSSLQSSSTRRRGLVTLPDVAPTVLAHHGEDVPASMTGGAWFPVEPPSGSRVAAAVELDAEATFIDSIKASFGTAYVVAQVVVYGVLAALLWRRARSLPRVAEMAVLAIAAFPLSTYLAGLVYADLGVAAYAGVLAAIDASLVAAVYLALRSGLQRLGALVAATAGVLVADVVTAAALQLNTVFGYSPLVAGRFAGVGNVAFAVLGVCGLLTGALIVHGARDRRGALVAAGVVYVALVVVVGAPQFGGDVGGTLALVPSLALTWMLLAGRRPDPRLVALALVGAVAALALFLAIDVARAPEQRTHLARLWLDMVAQGPEPLLNAVERKARANLRVFTSTIYTLFVPPAVAVLAWLLRSPRGRWERLAAAYPRLRAGLLGGILLGVLGFLVNDSGIVIPAMVLSFLLPMAALLHLSLDLEAPA